MSGRPPLHRKVKKQRTGAAAPAPAPAPAPAAVRLEGPNAPPYVPAPFRFPFFPSKNDPFAPNFNVNAYSREKSLSRFNPDTQRHEINSRTNKGLYFPNMVNREREYRGYELAIDKRDPSKDPVRGDKLIYVEYEGPISEVTVTEIDERYIKLQSDSTGQVFILDINQHGNDYILYKKKSMHQEEPINWGANQNFFENMGGSRRKSRKLKRKVMRKGTRKNVR